MSTAIASIVTTSTETTSALDSTREQQVCGIDEKQKEILTETWQPIDDDDSKQRVGIILFNRIFELAPGAIALFPKFRDVPTDQLEQNEDFRKHAFTVVDAVGLAVSFLDDLETLEGVLYDLGGTHVKYGIQAEHFEVVGQALLWTLQKQFGSNFKQDIEAAWIAFYGFVSHNMTRGLNDAYAATQED